MECLPAILVLRNRHSLLLMYIFGLTQQDTQVCKLSTSPTTLYYADQNVTKCILVLNTATNSEIKTLSWRRRRSSANSRCHWPINRWWSICICSLINCSTEERMLQSIQRCNSHSLVKLKHPQDQVLKLEIVGCCMTSFTEPSTAWTASVHTKDVVQLSRPRCLVLTTAMFSHSSK